MSNVSQTKFVTNWYLRQIGKSKCSAIRTVNDHLEVFYSTPLVRRMNDGFVLLNTDVRGQSWGCGLFDKAYSALTDIAVPISFEALRATGISITKLDVIYRGLSIEGYRKYESTILQIRETNRVLCTLRDRYWAGLVEPCGFYRDPLEMQISLVPPIVQEAMRKDNDPNHYPRQGEWYFVRRPDFKKPRGMKIEKWAGLDGKTRHTVRDKIVVDGKTYVAGTVHHSGRRHRLSLLSNGESCWYEVAESVQVASWQGRFYW